MVQKIVKYMEIFQYYKKLILSGEMLPNEKLPTEYEIVNKFNVSRHTVRQAISELEKDGVIYKEKARGAFVSNINISKVEKDNNNIVVVITTYMSDYIFPYLISGIDKRLSKEGYDILLLSTNNEKEKEENQLKKLLKYNVVGAIIEPAASAMDNVNIEYYRELKSKGIPYVMINAVYDEINQPYVVMNDEESGYVLCKHLIDNGHKKIAGLFKEDDLQGVKRKKGYIRALEENKIEVDKTIIGNFKTFEEDFYTYAFAKNLLSSNNRPTAIVCYNDNTAVKVIRVARELNIRIPEDLSIVGHDHDRTISNTVECGLTTIRHPKERMGEKAAEILISLIKKDGKEIGCVYEPEIIIKNSVSKV